MKKIFATFLLCFSLSSHAYVYDQRFPTFDVDKVGFSLTYQTDEDSGGIDIVLLSWDGRNWSAWGGPADVNSIIFSNVTDGLIMQSGSLYNFLQNCMSEAMRRAKIYAALPLPDPNNKVQRMEYAFKAKMYVENDIIKLPPPPLP